MSSSVPFDLTGKRVWVAGHRGMVGSAVVRRLEREEVGDVIVASSSELDLSRQSETEEFVRDQKPNVAIIAAARVGGIHANQSAQADFLYDNLMISANCLRACQLAGVEKTAVLGSSCIYPAESEQPMREDYLLTGKLEETNEGYAIAKIAALEYGKMLRRQYSMDVISLMPTNLYGPGDNYDLESSHVLPALLRKTHEARLAGSNTITLWGSGRPRREFLYVDDLADAVVFALQSYSDEIHLNVGTGTDVTIVELADIIGETVGWSGRYDFDATKPDGVARKLLDVSRINELGWSSTTPLKEGIELTYRAFVGTASAEVAPI